MISATSRGSDEVLEEGANGCLDGIRVARAHRVRGGFGRDGSRLSHTVTAADPGELQGALGQDLSLIHI